MRVGIAGASGYSGAELLRLVAAHPAFEPAIVTSREFAGRAVKDVYPNLPFDLTYTELDVNALAGLDVVFLALPHGASMTIGAQLAESGTRVVDFSADFRLDDPALYPQWFGKEHAAPSWLGKWIYGLPELHRDEIAGAALVANPGCYPTAALLALTPLLANGLVEPNGIVVSAASGVSGAGRGLNAGAHFSHVDGNVKAYGFPGHKHTPEIEQELSRLGGDDVRITFIPHLVPMTRGLLATCVATLAADSSRAAMSAAAHARYDDEPFVRVLDDAFPETAYLAGSNGAHVSYAVDERTSRVIAVTAIDNLGKGAAGQAIQNANIMLGLPETSGLLAGGLYP
ncbi:MAG: N-acetyl-gamma-glutamyl-phosphate reductase [Actinomycetota bacterium]|nr:N-acetyl-gamma-glutamyl-phosphate reductase [Actinomycetota bacterium]